MSVVGTGAEGTYAATAASTKVFVTRSPRGLDAEIRQTFRIYPEGTEFTARATSYDYALHRHGGGEILAYHWHPATQVSYPHLHISAEWGTAREFSRVHLPTGHLALVEFTLLLIREFAVIPQRSNWQRILINAPPPT